jgi:hypothetical protein
MDGLGLGFGILITTGETLEKLAVPAIEAKTPDPPVIKTSADMVTLLL